MKLPELFLSFKRLIGVPGGLLGRIKSFSLKPVEETVDRRTKNRGDGRGASRSTAGRRELNVGVGAPSDADFDLRRLNPGAPAS